MLARNLPSSPAITFPRSPACLSSSSGAPCVLPLGLKCPPIKPIHSLYEHMKRQWRTTTNLKLNHRPTALRYPPIQIDSYREFPIHINRNLDSTRNYVSISLKNDLPVERQPLVVSPRVWIWNPWRPGCNPDNFPITAVTPAWRWWSCFL